MTQSNKMSLPGQADATAQTGGASLAGGDLILEAHAQSKAQYLKMSESFGHLTALREELDKLLALGDMVDQNDVVKSASNLVGKGFGAHELAVMLSQMPDNPEGLRGWLQTTDQQVKVLEANAQQHMALARHQLGVDSLHVLMQDHMKGPASSTPQMGMAPQGAASPQIPAGMALSPTSPVGGTA